MLKASFNFILLNYLLARTTIFLDWWGSYLFTFSMTIEAVLAYVASRKGNELNMLRAIFRVLSTQYRQ